MTSFSLIKIIKVKRGHLSLHLLGISIKSKDSKYNIEIPLSLISYYCIIFYYMCPLLLFISFLYY